MLPRAGRPPGPLPRPHAGRRSWRPPSTPFIVVRHTRGGLGRTSAVHQRVRAGVRRHGPPLVPSARGRRYRFCRRVVAVLGFAARVGGTHPTGTGDRLWSSAWSIALTWTAVALVGVIGVFGPPLQWPAWMMDISPYTQIPRCPAEPRRRRRCSGSAPRSATGSSSTRALSHPGKPRTTSRAWPLAFPHD
jgi:hypothetical protein